MGVLCEAWWRSWAEGPDIDDVRWRGKRPYLEAEFGGEGRELGKMCDGRHLSSVQFDVLIVGGKVKPLSATQRGGGGNNFTTSSYLFTREQPNVEHIHSNTRSYC